ncbi:hypothetical protein PCO82_00265 [Pectobacteriaceae bacterium CE90]|nr:hypothetical protein PCO82_00265 [Pectobacteriaceae bacterium CE90]
MLLSAAKIVVVSVMLFTCVDCRKRTGNAAPAAISHFVVTLGSWCLNADKYYGHQGFLCEMLLVIYINVYFSADAEAIQLLFLTNVSQTKVIKDVRFVRAMLFFCAITGGMFYPFFTYWCFPIKGYKYEKINI